MVSPNTDEFLDLLASSQSRRLDDQRASFSNLPGLRLPQKNNQSVLGHLMTDDSKEPDEDFFDILVKCQVRGYFYHSGYGLGAVGVLAVLEFSAGLSCWCELLRRGVKTEGAPPPCAQTQHRTAGEPSSQGPRVGSLHISFQ